MFGACFDLARGRFLKKISNVTLLLLRNIFWIFRILAKVDLHAFPRVPNLLNF